MHLWDRTPHLLLANQGVDVEGQEEAVEQVVGEHVIEKLAVDDEDVVQVVQVVQVLGNQVTQLPPVLMPATNASNSSTAPHHPETYSIVFKDI